MIAKLVILLLATVIVQDEPSGEGAGDWILVDPPQVGATVEMPVLPVYTEQLIKPLRDREDLLVRSRSAVVNKGRWNFTFAYHDEQTPTFNRDKIKAILDGAVMGATTQVNGKQLKEKDIFFESINNRESHKGRDFVFECEIDDAQLQSTHLLQIRCQVFLVDRRLYTLSYISLKDDFDNDVAQRYFDSFKLVKVDLDQPPSPRPGRAAALAAEADSK